MDGLDARELFGEGLPGQDHYDVEEEVGHGAFSEVHRARDKFTGRTVALKHLYLSEPGQLPKHVLREQAGLEAIRHPNVISLLGFHQRGIGVCLALEYCITDLRRLLELRGAPPLDSALAKCIMQQLLRAIQACHQAGFMHRDIAPSNVLIAEDSGLIKLADFGQAHTFRDRHGGAPSSSTAGSAGGSQASGGTTDHEPGFYSPNVGTRWYKAPELQFSSHSYTPAVDLWSAGCIFAELLVGRPLFPGTSQLDQICRTIAVLGSINEEEWPGVRDLPDWGKLIFPATPAKPWAEVLPGVPPAAVNLMRGLMQYNPDRRLSAEQALASAYFQEDPAPAPPHALASLAQQLLSERKAAAMHAVADLQWEGL